MLVLQPGVYLLRKGQIIEITKEGQRALLEIKAITRALECLSLQQVIPYCNKCHQNVDPEFSTSSTDHIQVNKDSVVFLEYKGQGFSSE